MKKSIVVALSLGVGLMMTNVGRADIVSHAVNIANFGGDPSDGNAVTPELVVSHVFALPAIDSLDSVNAQLAHAFGSDVTIELIAPGGANFFIVMGDGPTGSPHQGGGDGDDLGVSPFGLANVSDYMIVPNGSPAPNWLNNGSPLPAGTYDQRLVAGESWPVGAFPAGNWTYNLYDSWDTVDAGSVGTIGLTYTVPEPGSIALLVMGAAGMLIRRRK